MPSTYFLPFRLSMLLGCGFVCVCVKHVRQKKPYDCKVITFALRAFNSRDTHGTKLEMPAECSVRRVVPSQML